MKAKPPLHPRAPRGQREQRGAHRGDLLCPFAQIYQIDNVSGHLAGRGEGKRPLLAALGSLRREQQPHEVSVALCMGSPPGLGGKLDPEGRVHSAWALSASFATLAGFSEQQNPVLMRNTPLGGAGGV